MVVNVQLMQNPNGRKEREKGGREGGKGAKPTLMVMTGLGQPTICWLDRIPASPELRQVALSRDFQNGASLITTPAKSAGLARRFEIINAARSRSNRI